MQPRLKRIPHPTQPVSYFNDRILYESEPELKPAIDFDEIKLRQRFMESGFNDNLTSPAGATGRYQIMPITSREYTQLTGKTGDLNNPEYNEQVRDYYMEKRLPQFKVVSEGNPTDSVRMAKTLAAYNWGPDNLNKHITNLKRRGIDVENSMDWIDTLPTEPRNYVNFILRGQDVNKYKNNSEYQKALEKYGLK